MRFARAGTASFAAVALAMVVLVPASARVQAQSKYGGTLVVGLAAGDPDSLDPTVSRGSAIGIYPEFCLKLFVSVRNHGTIGYAPLLAASLPEISKDKLSYTIRLRQGIQFNDGTPLNAQAVVTTVQRFMTYPGSSRASDFTNVESVSASGPYTVVFHLKSPDATLVTTQMYVLSPTALAKEGANFAANPVCAGPFMYDHRVPSDNVTLVKSPYWYQRDAVHLDKIVFKILPDAAAAAAALKAGDIQVLDQVSPTELAGVEKDSSLRVLRSPQLGWRGLIINMGNKNGIGIRPYTNVGTPLASSATLRQAFEEAIDRNLLNKVVFGGIFQATCTPIPPANTAWFDSIKVPCTPYDPSDAKKLVAKSGFTNPTVHLLVANTTDRLRFAQFVQAQEAAVGINVIIDSTDSATSVTRATNGNFDTFLTGLEPGSVEPNGLVYQFFATPGVRNYGGYSNPRADYVLNNGLKATKIKARSTNYRVLHQILHDDRPTIFLYNETTLAAFSTSVSGVWLWPNGQVIVSDAQFKSASGT
jgi:peptide/nickel transport system substrate-binding protein